MTRDHVGPDQREGQAVGGLRRHSLGIGMHRLQM